MSLSSTLAQGRRAVKRGTHRSCQQARDLIRVNVILLLLFRFQFRKFRIYVFFAWNVSWSPFCVVLQSNSEHISLQPLRVEILHATVMAHQTFALRLGFWFQKVIGYSGNEAVIKPSCFLWFLTSSFLVNMSSPLYWIVFVYLHDWCRACMVQWASGRPFVRWHWSHTWTEIGLVSSADSCCTMPRCTRVSKPKLHF